MISFSPAVSFKSVAYSLIVAERLSFSAAAEVLGIQQSAVSRRVIQLEDVLEVSLFERHSRGVRPTLAGHRFFTQARIVLASMDEAVATAREMGRGERGQLRIGLLTSLTGGKFRAFIEAFASGHPDVEIEPREGAWRDYLTMLRDRRLDAALMTGAINILDCDSALLWSERVYIALPERHPLASQPQMSWRDLHGERFIVSRSEPGPESMIT